MIRFTRKADILNIGLTALSVALSVGVMLYGVIHYGLRETWPELVLNLFYIAALVMMGLYFFNHLNSNQFNYWSSVCVGITVLLRDILFPPPMDYYVLHLICLTLSVLLVLMLLYFYARKDWETYTKRNLWLIFAVDVLLASFYNYHLMLETLDEYTIYLATEIWIRPTITYGLVACYISEEE